MVEGLHLRQWLVRGAAPIAILATNGTGWLEIDWLPTVDAVTTSPKAVESAWIAGAVLTVLAAIVRVLSKGVLVRKTTLTTGGIYRWARHPFYLGTLLGGVGVLVLAGPLGACVAVAWLVAAAPVFGITIAGEEDGLRHLYGDRWDAFVAAVPALAPRPWRRGPAPIEPVTVTWANLVAEREPPRLARFLAGAALVAICRLGGEPSSLILAVPVLLLLGSYVLPGQRRASSRRAR